MTVELTEFLRARFAEDEAQAREDYANGMTGHLWKHYPVDAYERIQWLTLARGKRMAAECEAKRRIVERHGSFRNGWSDADGEPFKSCAHDMKAWPCPDLLDLALPYADHQDYRDEWRP